ncbi:MAG: FecR family protein [Methylophilales bacterium]|nr:FecR family protein [Methylophilales bacterium]
MKTYASIATLTALLLSLVAPQLANAAGAAVIKNLSGAVSAQRADGSVRALGKNSELEVGEVITTAKGSYASVKFTDGGELTLQPDTTVKIDQYGFDEAKPKEDSLVFSLVKGGLRSITGLVGKRGNRDAYKLNTETATIGIRGTDYRAAYCNGNCGKNTNGLYLSVISGIINAKNAAGDVDFSAGTFGFVSSKTILPVNLPNKPGGVPGVGDKDKGKGDTSGSGCYTSGA